MAPSKTGKRIDRHRPLPYVPGSTAINSPGQVIAILFIYGVLFSLWKGVSALAPWMYRHIEPHKLVLGVTLSISTLAVCLFVVKTRRPFEYALIEIGFALASVAAPLLREESKIEISSQFLRESVLPWTGGAYLLIRGLANMRDALRKRCTCCVLHSPIPAGARP
jgi:hypothetical protein